jgi:anti-sigma regulatory factor (Ser/Thr protein kinase)
MASLSATKHTTNRAGHGPAKPHNSYQHEAFLYRGREEFVAGTVPFIRDSVALGQPVLVAVIEPRLNLLREALGSDLDTVPFVDAVRFVDMGELGRNPARIIPEWLGFVEEHSADGRPVRGIGEPIWAGRRPEEIVECQLHEGLLNLAVGPDTPLWLRCLYDVAALDADLAEEALRSHPAVVELGSYRGSTGYGGLHHVDSVFRSGLPEPPADSVRLPFGDADLVAVRKRVNRCAIDAGLDADRSGGLSAAVTEIATNSVQHGGGDGVLLTWTRPDALVCEVTDRGQLDDPLVGRRILSPNKESGRGVWLANQICDLVQIRSTAEGCAVRLVTWL